MVCDSKKGLRRHMLSKRAWEHNQRRMAADGRCMSGPDPAPDPDANASQNDKNGALYDKCTWLSVLKLLNPILIESCETSESINLPTPVKLRHNGEHRQQARPSGGWGGTRLPWVLVPMLDDLKRDKARFNSRYILKYGMYARVSSSTQEWRIWMPKILGKAKALSYCEEPERRGFQTKVL